MGPGALRLLWFRLGRAPGKRQVAGPVVAGSRCSMTGRRLVAYKRVSTDDKGQDPSRQDKPLQAFADRNGDEIVAWVVDEGTSAGEKGVPTLDRPKVKEALKLARELKAHALLVENVDRWTRKGSMDLGYSLFVLLRDHRLELLFADLPEDDFAREVLPPLMATLARMDNKRKSDMATTSAAKRKARGDRLGRPPKPDLTDEELEEVVEPLSKAGHGLRRIAAALTRRRLVGRDGIEVVEPKARRQRHCSESWLRDQLAKRVGTNGLSTRVYRPCHVEARPNVPNPTQLQDGVTA